MEEQLRAMLERLDSDLAYRIDEIEGLIMEDEDYIVTEECHDYVELMEEIRGKINA